MSDTLLRVQNDLAAARFEQKQSLRAARDAEVAARDLGDTPLARDLLDMAAAFRQEAEDLVPLILHLESLLRAAE